MLLGRGPETTRLDELVSEAAGGRGGALVIEGQPGVGKTAHHGSPCSGWPACSPSWRCRTPPCISSVPG
jgi:hypothetical protein